MAETRRHKILFVDDDPHILQGLQRMLHSMRHEWEMEFVDGGEKALSLIREEPIDVLVTDMKMPGMDGIQLLTEVRKQFPQVIRIVLSGYSDYQMILMSVPLAHQFLTKPCDPKSLVSAVNRAGSLRDVLAEAGLKKLVAQVSSLPSLPTLYVELEKAVNDERTNLNNIAEIISLDMGMTAKVMQIANSAFFGLQRKVSTPEEAVLLIGIKTLQALILSTHIFSQFKNTARFRPFLEALWCHSQATAGLAKSIAKQAKGDKTTKEYASTAGLLHDCGELILADNFPDEYDRVLALTGRERMPLWQAEEKIFGAHHGSIGAYLLGIWGLPNPIIEALAFHHRPNSFLQEGFNILTAVHVADALEAENDTIENPVNGVDETYLKELSLIHHLPEWRRLAQEGKGKGETHDS